MRKMFILLVGAIFMSLSLLFSKRGEIVLNEILLENVEAMAEPEVEVEAICMGTEGICIIYSNGFFIRGKRVA